MLLSILETTHVNSSIFEFLCAKSIHEPILKLSDVIFLQICIVVRSLAIEYSIQEISLVVTTIVPPIPAVAVFLTVLEISNIF